MSKLHSKTALIIGGSASIGTEIVTQFKTNKMRVITTYTSKDVFNHDESVTSFYLNLSNEESIKKVTRRLHDVTQTIDIVIFLAGILPGQKLEDYDFSMIDKVITVNFSGQTKLLMNILSLLTHSSCILFFSSISAQRGSYDPIYAASKGALLSLVKSLAKSLPKGCRINSIAPGLIYGSAMFEEMSRERQELHRKQVHSNKLLKSKDLAKVVFDLCQDHWAHLNGACIDLNGGQYVR